MSDRPLVLTVCLKGLDDYRVLIDKDTSGGCQNQQYCSYAYKGMKLIAYVGSHWHFDMAVEVSYKYLKALKKGTIDKR